ncbi:MAG: metal-sensitive transcriptional regulator [Verrucomicrobiota bacterium]
MSEKHHHPKSERKSMMIRARKVAGQLHAIERMIESDQDCSEVLMQVIAARRGLKSLAEKIIDSHIHHCIAEATNSEEGQRNLRHLLQVLERYVE